MPVVAAMMMPMSVTDMASSPGIRRVSPCRQCSRLLATPLRSGAEPSLPFMGEHSYADLYCFSGRRAFVRPRRHARCIRRVDDGEVQVNFTDIIFDDDPDFTSVTVVPNDAFTVLYDSESSATPMPMSTEPRKPAMSRVAASCRSFPSE